MVTPIIGRNERVGNLSIPGRRPDGLNTSNLNLPNSQTFVWIGPTVGYTWPTAAITHISSSNVGDTGTVKISGTSYPDWADVTDMEITLQGQTKTALPTSLSRFNYARACCNLLGNVYIYQDGTITNGVPDNLNLVSGYIPSTHNQSRHGAYSIPYGYKAVIQKVIITTRLGASGTLQVYIYSRDQNSPVPGVVYRDQDLAFAQGSDSILAFDTLDYPFFGGTEFWIEALAPLANNFGVSANIIMEKVKV